MKYIIGIILIIIGVVVFNANKKSEDDPNWGAIFGLILIFGGCAAIFGLH